ncbi:MAG: YgcG family protein [Methylococcaceae bacterium]|nr:MAG: YgcG family protein [Methylococcaceae bacterium]
MSASRRLISTVLGLWLGLFAAFAVAADAPAQLPLPTLNSRVTDLTGTLDAGQRAALEANLAALEKAKGAQLVVVIVPTTQPETIEQFGIRLMDAWKIGRKGIDDGVILLVAKNDRKLRIEVGYGLEGVLTDAAAKRIIAETITPHFRKNEFYPGIAAGVRAIRLVIQGESLPAPPPPQSESSEESGGSIWSWLAVALFSLPYAIGILGLLIALLIDAGLVYLAHLWLDSLLIDFLVFVVGYWMMFSVNFLGIRHIDLESGSISSGGFRGSFSGGGGFFGGGGGGGGGGASGSW